MLTYYWLVTFLFSKAISQFFHITDYGHMITNADSLISLEVFFHASTFFHKRLLKTTIFRKTFTTQTRFRSRVKRKLTPTTFKTLHLTHMFCHCYRVLESAINVGFILVNVVPWQSLNYLIFRIYMMETGFSADE